MAGTDDYTQTDEEHHPFYTVQAQCYYYGLSEREHKQLLFWFRFYM